jgi:hypothetical protein
LERKVERCLRSFSLGKPLKNRQLYAAMTKRLERNVPH